MKTSPARRRALLPSSSAAGSRRGMTLVEVVIAMLIASGICAGLYQVGWQARRYAEYARLATEARELAKEKLEEILSHDFKELQSSSYWWNTESNSSSTGASIVRQTRAVWHAPDASVVDASSGTYAEIHVDVVFRSPLWKGIATNTFSTIVQ